MKFIWKIGVLLLLAGMLTTLSAQTVPPSQHITCATHYGYRDKIQIVDSVYAGSYYSSMISFSCKILYNGNPIDSMYKFGNVTLTMRAQGNNYQVNPYVTGSLNLPQDVSLMGIKASSFSLGIINTTVSCNRNRPIIIDMKMNRLGRYTLIMELIHQNNATKQNVGTSCCNYAMDCYATDGTPGAVWISDTVSFDLHIDTVYTHLHIDSACSYTWRDSLYQTSGVYSHEYKDSLGNDSIVYLYLNAGNYQIRRKETVHICEGASYRFKNRLLTQSGNYYDTLRSQYDCDSIRQLELVVHAHQLSRDTLNICPGGEVNWHGRKLTQAGEYVDSLKSVYGCDSLCVATVLMRPVYLDTAVKELCAGGCYVWHGKQLSVAGVYDDSLQSIYGCDSVFRLRLRVHPHYLYTDSAAICANGSYRWRNRLLTRAGVYDDTLQTRYGCDSIFRLVFTVYPDFLQLDTETICQTESYLWRGRNLTQPGLYADSLLTGHGCDSVYQLLLKVNPTYLTQDSIEICNGAVCFWHGKPYTRSGLYRDTLRSATGCDSVCELTLEIHPLFSWTDSVYLCDNESFEWRGRQLRQSGLYTDSLKTIHRCDSIYRLQLFVSPAYLHTDTVSLCEGDTLVWKGKAYAESGVYSDSLLSVDGCDSVSRLHLTVHPAFFITESFEICADETYVWHRRSLSAEGVYYDSLQTRWGCDSVFQLTLKVNPLKETRLYDTLCEGADYTGYGFNLSAASILEADSLHFIRVLPTYKACDSTVHLYLWLRTYPHTIGEIRGDTLLSQSGTYWYEVDSLPELDAYVWSVSNAAWQWLDDGCRLAVSVVRADTATLTVKGRHVCGETEASRLFVKATVKVPGAREEDGWKVYPNPVRDELCVECLQPEGAEGVRWEWCTVEGRRLKQGFSSQNRFKIRLSDMAKGPYLLKVSLPNGQISILKINKL